MAPDDAGPASGDPPLNRREPLHALFHEMRVTPIQDSKWILTRTAIIQAGRSANIIVDGPATVSVATWAYSHAAQLGAAAWVSGNIVEPFTGGWHSLLNVYISASQPKQP